MAYDKISNIYNRLIKTQENVQKLLNSINIWGNIPLYQRNTASPKALLDIENRSEKCKVRSIEAINSKTLSEYTMEENYRLFFNLPSIEPPKEIPCKNRLKKTILQQLDRQCGREGRDGREKSYAPIVTVS